MSAGPASPFVAWRPDTAPRQGPVSASRPLRDSTTGLLNLYSRCNPHFCYFRSVPRRCLTKQSQPFNNDGFDNNQHDYILHVNDNLSDGRGNDFIVLDLLGTGTFGQVVKCRHLSTAEIVAVKVIKNQPAYFNQAWVEINILRILHRNNSHDDTRHVVKFYSHFIFRGHLCLVFERLSINLYELLKQNSYVGVNCETLRTFLSQLLSALNVLVQSEVIHCDLKPENILLENLDTAQVKIIDFGSACQLHYPVYSYVQSRFYRAPEVLLGCPEYDSKIDMWSLGCVAGELFLGIPLFPGQNEMNMVSRIVEMLGDLPDRFLHRCRHTSKFFNSSRSSEYAADDMHVFQLKSVSQYEQENNVSLPEWKRFFKEKKLRDIIMTYPFRTPEPHTQENEARESFIDLLSGMLKIDPRDRWTPAEALQHPFMRGESLPGGQPWTPPTRPYRAMRSKPVVIERPTREQPTPVDEFYSASAPNFTPKGRLNMNTTWGTGAGGQPSAISRGTIFQLHPHHHALHGPSAYMHEETDSPGPRQPFAPGSYVPPSAMTMYGTSVGHPTGPRRGSLGSGSANGPSTGSGSHDFRSFLLQSGSAASDSQQRSMGIAWDSPGGGTRGSTSPLPHVASLRMGNGIHVSGSRESLTGSLRMSGSRESLGMGIPSVGDMGEDLMFPFEPDEKTVSSAHGIPFLPASLQAQHHNSPHPSQSVGMRSGGASAALPPPAPRTSLGRGVPAAYGNPAGLSSYGYSYSNLQQQVRSFNASMGMPQSPGGDVNMGDVEQDGQRSGSPVVAPNGLVRGSVDPRFVKQMEESGREQFSDRRSLRKGT